MPSPSRHHQKAHAGGTRRRQGGGSGVKGSSEQNQRLIQCPLCGKNFPKGVVEYHAAGCEGKRVDGDEADMDSGRRRHEEPEVLEVHLPPEKLGKSAAPPPAAAAAAAAAKT